jgi:hypothetical protein
MKMGVKLMGVMMMGGPMKDGPMTAGRYCYVDALPFSHSDLFG